MAENNKVPKLWVVKQMGDVFTIERGGSPRPIENFITNDENGINWIKIGDTKNVIKHIYHTKEKIIQEGVKRSRMVYVDDFILSNSMSFGKPFIMKTTGCIHDGWLVIRKNETIDNNYLYYLLSSPLIYQQFSKLAKGSTVKNLNIEAVKQVEIKYPPFSEQLAIVSKIEELLSELENGIQQLQIAQQQLKVYRQSLLKWAFEGKLTNKNVKEGELPEGWKWIKLGDGLEYVGSGVTPRGGQSVYKTSGIIFLRSQNIYPNKLKLNNVAFITEEIDEKMKRTRVKPNDVLLNITGASIGRCAFVPNNFAKANVNQHVCILRVNQELINSVFLSSYLNSPFSQKEIMNTQSGATRQGLNFQQVRNIKIPLCSIRDQLKIIEELESKLTVCDKIEETISQSLLQAETLRQSILKKAFEGRLV